MRHAFAETVTRLAGVDEDIILLAGDIGNRLLINIKKNFQQDSITVELQKHQ